MTLETKIRTLAMADASLQAFFGTNPFRWFYLQLPPGFVMQATGTTSMVVQRISTLFLYAQEGLVNLNKPRIQFTIYDPDATVVDAATAAVIAWLGTVNFASNAQFTSPPSDPRQKPNFVVNQRPGLVSLMKTPVPTMALDVRIWNADF